MNALKTKTKMHTDEFIEQNLHKLFSWEPLITTRSNQKTHYSTKQNTLFMTIYIELLRRARKTIVVLFQYQWLLLPFAAALCCLSSSACIFSNDSFHTHTLASSCSTRKFSCGYNMDIARHMGATTNDAKPVSFLQNAFSSGVIMKPSTGIPRACSRIT